MNGTATTEIYTLSYTTLFRSLENDLDVRVARLPEGEDPDSFVLKHGSEAFHQLTGSAASFVDFIAQTFERSEEHTSELQSRRDLVCRLLLEKKKVKSDLFLRS